MPKSQKEKHYLVFFVRPFSQAIFYIVLFLIFIGDKARWFLKIFLSVFRKLFKYFSNLLSGYYNSLKSTSQFLRRIKLSFLSGTDRLRSRLFITLRPITLPKIFLPKIQTPQIKLTRPSFPQFLLLKVKYFVLGVILSILIILVYQGYQSIRSLPDPHLIGIVNYPVSSKLFDRNGKLLFEIYREQNRTPIKLKELPDYVLEATLAIEDKDFYKHNGVSFYGGILRAVKDMWLTKTLQGGSTITQQLVKSALLTPERTIQRKIKEIILALWTERIFTKDKILEMYLNQVPYGGSAYGIEEAAQNYFDKQAKELTLNEAAFLAGLPQAPSLYSPYVNPELARQRRNEVFKNMYEQKYVSSEQYQQETKAPLTIRPPQQPIKAPHFVFYIKSILEQKYGMWQVENGGLRIITSLDLDLQAKTEQILKEELEKIKNLNVTNGAVLVTAPFSGEILAMVGSKNYFALPSGAFNVTTALRQPGSAIKPLMYSLALENGYTAATIIDDSPVVFNILGSQPYRPINYDNSFHGKLPLRYVLANSYNVPAVKTLYTLGVDNFIKHAQKMGITTWTQPERYGLSLTLGGGEVKMIDMAVAFGTLANQGDKVDLNPILKISDYRNNLIFQLNKAEQNKVISKEIAFIISDILSDNFARRFSFGVSSFLEIPGFKVAVKTGTTNDKKDNWTLGYTPQFLTAVWVGNNDSSPMHPYLTSGITGAAPIWNRVMSYVLQLKNNEQLTFISPPEVEFKEPEGIIKKNCYFGRAEYFVKGTENTASCRESLFKASPTPSVSE